MLNFLTKGRPRAQNKKKQKDNNQVDAPQVASDLQVPEETAPIEPDPIPLSLPETQPEEPSKEPKDRGQELYLKSLAAAQDSAQETDDQVRPRMMMPQNAMAQQLASVMRSAGARKSIVAIEPTSVRERKSTEEPKSARELKSIDVVEPKSARERQPIDVEEPKSARELKSIDVVEPKSAREPTTETIPERPLVIGKSPAAVSETSVVSNERPTTIYEKSQQPEVVPSRPISMADVSMLPRSKVSLNEDRPISPRPTKPETPPRPRSTLVSSHSIHSIHGETRESTERVSTPPPVVSRHSTIKREISLVRPPPPVFEKSPAATASTEVISNSDIVPGSEPETLVKSDTILKSDSTPKVDLVVVKDDNVNDESNQEATQEITSKNESVQKLPEIIPNNESIEKVTEVATEIKVVEDKRRSSRPKTMIEVGNEPVAIPVRPARPHTIVVDATEALPEPDIVSSQVTESNEAEAIKEEVIPKKIPGIYGNQHAALGALAMALKQGVPRPNLMNRNQESRENVEPSSSIENVRQHLVHRPPPPNRSDSPERSDTSSVEGVRIPLKVDSGRDTSPVRSLNSPSFSPKKMTPQSANFGSGTPLVFKKKDHSISGDDKALEKSALLWMNHFVEGKAPPLEDLFKPLADGLLLITAIETASGDSVGKYNKRAMMPIHKLDNIAVALKFLAKKGAVISLTPQDVLDGHRNHILSLFSQILKVFPI